MHLVLPTLQVFIFRLSGKAYNSEQFLVSWQVHFLVSALEAAYAHFQGFPLCGNKAQAGLWDHYRVSKAPITKEQMQKSWQLSAC